MKKYLQIFILSWIIISSDLIAESYPGWKQYPVFSGFYVYSFKDNILYSYGTDGLIQYNLITGEKFCHSEMEMDLSQDESYHCPNGVVDSSGYFWFLLSSKSLVSYRNSTFNEFVPPDSFRYYLGYCQIMCCDKFNNLWFSTDYGLMKYDRIRWSIIPFDSSLKAAYVNPEPLVSDTSGNIWFISLKGLIKYDGHIFKTFNSENTDVIKEGRLDRIIIDNRSNLYVVCNDTSGFIKIYKNENDNWLEFLTDKFKIHRSSIAFDTSNNVFFHNYSRIWYCDGKELKNVDSNSNCYIFNGIYCDKNNSLWLPSKKLLKFSGNKIQDYTDSFNVLQADKFIKLVVDSSNNIWAMPNISDDISQPLLYKYDGTMWTKHVINSLTTNSNHYDFICDKYNNIWISNDNKLVKYTNGKWNVFEFDTLVYPNQSISKMDVDYENNIWMSSNKGNLFKFDGKNWSFYPGLDSNNRYFSIDKKNNIWVVNENHLAKFDGNTWISMFDSLKDGPDFTRVGDITFDADNNLWLDWTSVYEQGYISEYDGIKWNRYYSCAYTANLKFDRKNILWSSSWFCGQLYYLDVNSKKQRYVSPYPMGSTNCTTQVVFDKNNVMWIIAGKQGIFSNENKYFTSIPENNIIKEQFLSISPNPVSQTTAIQYQTIDNCNVKLSLVNLLGQEIAVLKDGFEEAGDHNYEIPISNYNLPDGVYFVRLVAGDRVLTEKVIILK